MIMETTAEERAAWWDRLKGAYGGSNRHPELPFQSIDEAERCLRDLDRAIARLEAEEARQAEEDKMIEEYDESNRQDEERADHESSTFRGPSIADYPTASQLLVDRLMGPHEWGWRDPIDGTFVVDTDTVWEAAAALDSPPIPEDLHERHQLMEIAAANGYRKGVEAMREACVEIARTSSNKAEIVTAIRARPSP